MHFLRDSENRKWGTQTENESGCEYLKNGFNDFIQAKYKNTFLLFLRIYFPYFKHMFSCWVITLIF